MFSHIKRYLDLGLLTCKFCGTEKNDVCSFILGEKEGRTYYVTIFEYHRNKVNKYNKSVPFCKDCLQKDADFDVTKVILARVKRRAWYRRNDVVDRVLNKLGINKKGVPNEL